MINDPALNMKAYNVVIPADWKYQGTLQAGDSRDDNPTPVIGAYSPDGLSEYRRCPDSTGAGGMRLMLLRRRGTVSR